jgi:methionyl-tRNA synthetase
MPRPGSLVADLWKYKEYVMATGRKKAARKTAKKTARKTTKKAKAKKAASKKSGSAKVTAKAEPAAAKKAKKPPAKTGVAKKTTEKTAKKGTQKSAKKSTTKAKPTASESRVVRSEAAPKPKAARKPKAGETAVETPNRKGVAKTSAATPPKPKKPAGKKAPAPLAAVPETAVASESEKPFASTTEPVVEESKGPAKASYYITTAIAYPNGVPHIGHAYEAIATDALARFQRHDGKDVFFLTGTDEHGLKMMQTAQLENLPTLEVATRNAARFKEMDRVLDISFDRFIRTSEEQHHRSSQAIWQRMADNGDIYLDSYAGWYSVRDEAYYAEDETVVGDDQVRCGPQGTPVEWVEERSYFFRLSAYQEKLLALYENRPDFIGPESRKNEVVSFVKSGLRDLSISRTTFDWGVKVPNDPEHVMYVWVDALTNYITGVGFPDEKDPNWRYWPADVHIIGKDIIRFHAVYWPAFLMSAGIPLQKRVFAHGFLFNKGEKMSKSVGNVVDPFNLAQQYGVDQVRYFFLREVPFGQDGSYNHEAIVARINADLANDLGNLAQRSLSMISKQLGGVLPEPGAFSDNDKAILALADGMIELARTAISAQQIHQALNAVWAVVAEANRYFAGEAPWALAKTDPTRQRTVLYVTAEVVRQIAVLTQPVMPQSSAKLLDMLGIPADQRDFNALGGATRIAPGTVLPAPTGIFPRYIEPSAA